MDPFQDGYRSTSVPTTPDPAPEAFSRSLAENPPIPPESPLDEQRDIMDTLASMNPPLPQNVAREHVTLATETTAELITPPDAHPGRAIVYAHGGAFVNGRTPSVWHYPVYRIAAAANASLLYVLYRLAPEHPFPAAGDDVIAGYQYLAARGSASENVVFVADSAGVNIAATALLALRAQGHAMPAGFVGIGPWIDVTEGGDSRRFSPLDPLVIPDQLNAAARAYLGSTSAESPEANPLCADLTGLPPIRLLVGSVEVLKDDTMRFSARACQAGVEVHVETWEGLPHGWYIFPTVVAEAEATYQRIGDLVRELTPLEPDHIEPA
jgi:epsilon-lactone hydrolase